MSHLSPSWPCKKQSSASNWRFDIVWPHCFLGTRTYIQLHDLFLGSYNLPKGSQNLGKHFTITDTLQRVLKDASQQPGRKIPTMRLEHRNCGPLSTGIVESEVYHPPRVPMCYCLPIGKFSELHILGMFMQGPSCRCDGILASSLFLS